MAALITGIGRGSFVHPLGQKTPQTPALAQLFPALRRTVRSDFWPCHCDVSCWVGRPFVLGNAGYMNGFNFTGGAFNTAGACRTSGLPLSLYTGQFYRGKLVPLRHSAVDRGQTEGCEVRLVSGSQFPPLRLVIISTGDCGVIIHALDQPISKPGQKKLVAGNNRDRLSRPAYRCLWATTYEPDRTAVEVCVAINMAV